MKAEIEIKIILKNGVEITLKDEDARELYNKLDGLFSPKKEFIPYPYPVYREPYYYKWGTCTGDSITITCNEAQ